MATRTAQAIHAAALVSLMAISACSGEEPTPTPRPLPTVEPTPVTTATAQPTATLEEHDPAHDGEERTRERLALVPIAIDEPQTSQTDLSPQEQSCLKDKDIGLEDLALVAGPSPSSSETTAVIVECLRDETVLRLFLTQLIGQTEPFSVETSMCIREGFTPFDLRGLVAPSGAKDSPANSLVLGMAALSVSVACMDSGEWETYGPRLGMRTEDREGAACLFDELGGPAALAEAMKAASLSKLPPEELLRAVEICGAPTSPTLPTTTPMLTDAATSQADDESATLLRTAAEVRGRIIPAVVEGGCALVRTEGSYSALLTLPDGEVSGDPSGEVSRIVIERTAIGSVKVVAGSTSVFGSGAMRGEFGDPLDFDAYLDNEVDGVTDMLRVGKYTGPASFLGRPALRYEVRMERPGGGGLLGSSAGTLLVRYFDEANPFIRGEEQYLLLPDGSKHLERQWYVSEFQTGMCATEDDGSEAEAVTREIRTRAGSMHKELLAQVKSGCTLELSIGGLREAEQVARTDWLEGEEAIGLLERLAVIAGVSEQTGEVESRHLPEGVVNVQFYGGETELDGQPAVRFVRRDLHVAPDGLHDVLTVGEYVRTSPLFFRVKTYVLLHDGGLQPRRTYTVTTIQSVVCPSSTPTPSTEMVSEQTGQPPVREPITADGSAVVFPVTLAAAEGFRKEWPDIDIRLFVSGTGGGFRRFTAGDVDIANASRPIRDSEAETAVANGIEYIEMRIGTEGLAVVAQLENDFVDCLTVEELNTIWAPGSTVNSWKDIRQGFPDVDIRLYGPDSFSGTYDHFMEEINGAQSSRSDYTASNDVSVLAQGVAGHSGALGFFGYAFYQENDDTLKTIAIDAGEGCVVPTPASMEDGSYKPLSRPLFIYVNVASLQRPEVRGFVEHYMGHGYDLVVGESYLPVAPSVYAANKAAAGR